MKYINSQKGFTLIEMIVSLGIFTVVAVIAVGALLKISDANRKAITLKTAINNLNFVLESMSREMRLGSNYNCNMGVGNNSTCDNNSNNQDWVLSFKSQKLDTNGCNLTYAYWYDEENKTIKKAQERICDDGRIRNEDNYDLVISPDIIITDSKVILNENNNNNAQPRVLFMIKGEVGKRVNEKTEFVIQTTISQRPSK